jgi:hypothetical protein
MKNFTYGNTDYKEGEKFMKRLIIKDKKYLTESEYDEIELQFAGQILIDSVHKSIKINKLINNKSDKSEYDIAVCGKDGNSAKIGSGEDGEDAKTDPGRVNIKINCLEGDFKIRSNGGLGGNGADGVDGDNGGDGGNGGKGSDAPWVLVDCVPDENGGSVSDYRVYYVSSHGGYGGYGGNGGTTSLMKGIGGIAAIDSDDDTKGTKGGKYGNGGDAGTNGQNGVIVIINPDGSTSINGEVYKPEPENAKPFTGTLDFSDDNHIAAWINAHGGIENLMEDADSMLLSVLANTIKKARRKRELGIAQEDNIITRLVKAAVPLSPNTEAGSNFGGMYDLMLNAESSYANTTIDSVRKNIADNETKPSVIGCLFHYELQSQTESGEVKYTYQLDNLFDGSDTDVSEPFITQISRDTFKEKFLVTTLWPTFILGDNTMTSAVSASVKCDLDVVASQSFISCVKVTDPVYRNPTRKNASSVIILYNRMPDSSSPAYDDADYFDGFYKTNSSTSELKTIVPLSGVVFINELAGKEILSVEPVPFEDMGNWSKPNLNYELNGASYVNLIYHPDYTLPALSSELKTHFKYGTVDGKKALTFDFNIPVSGCPYDWNEPLRIAAFDRTNHKGCLSLSFDMRITYRWGGVTYTSDYSISISSKESRPSSQDVWFISNEGSRNSGTVYIPLIAIYYGCFSADAKIKVVQGIKRADEIRIGDQIEVYAGEILTVDNIYTGNDETIFCIITENDMVTKVSGGHAMKLYSSDNPDGVKISAGKIKPGDILMTPSGNVTVKYCDEVPYNNTVYNFTFAERQTPQYIEADGFWSGDFNAQNKSE